MPEAVEPAEPDRQPDPGRAGPGGQAEPRDAGQCAEPDPGSGSGSSGGLSWSCEFDLEGVLAAAGVSLEGDPCDEESLAAERDLEEGDGTPRDLTGIVAERLPAGPGLAAWLADARPDGLTDFDLPGVAAACRRVASWAQAAELAAVAAMASRSAARDRKVGVDADGRPTQIPAGAATEVSLALAMTHGTASWWAGLAVALRWRLAGTGAALASGDIDLGRARLIHEATVRLTDDVARAVEEMVLPRAGRQTTAQLRAALRRAVIAADPRGAEERRKDAEFRAKVSLYSDEDGTAAVIGSKLPGTHAAAAMARITAMARAMKASGARGGLDLLRAEIFIGLLLGTLPLIPPRPPATDDPHDPHDPVGGGHGPGGPAGRGSGPPAGTAAADHPGDEDQSWRDVPCPTDADAPPDDSAYFRQRPPPSRLWPSDDDDEDAALLWPPLPDTIADIPPFLGDPPEPGARPSPQEPDPGARTRRPPPGLLDLTIPWTALAGLAPAPAMLGRVGPITAPQAIALALTAVPDPDAQWRVIITDPAGHALATERIRRGSLCRPRRDHHARGVVGRVTITIPATTLDQPWPPTGTPRGGILTAALRAAQRAATRHQKKQAADAAHDGGCAHTEASAYYRPPTRMREYVEARDQTCRQPYCRQPAWRTDLDHTIPWDQGGPTCPCDLGAFCRTHHQVKQLPGWTVRQPRPGHFEWTTPTGRTYTTSPDTYPT